MNSISPKQLKAERESVHKQSPQLYHTLLQTADDALRTYITLHYAYHNLSQNTPDFTWRSQRLLAALLWIQHSIQDKHELHAAIHDAKHILSHMN